MDNNHAGDLVAKLKDTERELASKIASHRKETCAAWSDSPAQALLAHAAWRNAAQAAPRWLAQRFEHSTFNVDANSINEQWEIQSVLHLRERLARTLAQALPSVVRVRTGIDAIERVSRDSETEVRAHARAILATEGPREKLVALHGKLRALVHQCWQKPRVRYVHIGELLELGKEDWTKLMHLSERELRFALSEPSAKNWHLSGRELRLRIRTGATKAAGFPQMIPANLIVNPVAHARIATFGVNAFGNPLSRSIMPEGFMTDTGVLPSSNDATGQQPF